MLQWLILSVCWLVEYLATAQLGMRASCCEVGMRYLGSFVAAGLGLSGSICNAAHRFVPNQYYMQLAKMCLMVRLTTSCAPASAEEPVLVLQGSLEGR
jgi:hypothetical protein